MTSDDLPTGAVPAQPGEPDRSGWLPVTTPPPRRLRPATLAWGLVLITCGAALLVAATGRQVDLGLLGIVLLAGAGVALVTGSLLRGRRSG